MYGYTSHCTYGIMPNVRVHDAADWMMVAPHLMVLSLRRTVFFLLACPGMMNVLAMYLARKHGNRNSSSNNRNNIDRMSALYGAAATKTQGKR